MPYSEKLDEALVYAHQLHRNQERKGSGVPYVNHLLAVASIVGENGGSEEQVIAGLLHDAVEDQGGKETAAEIRRRFGETVAQIVEGCSDTDVSPKPPWRARKEAYLESLKHHSPEVLLVSAADKLHNLRSILADHRQVGEEIWKRFSGKRDGTLWYYRTLIETYRQIWSHPLIEELEAVYVELEGLVRKNSMA